MAYRIRYHVWVDWVGPGEGPMAGLAGSISPGGGAGSYTKQFVQSPVAGTVVEGTGTLYAGGHAIVAADVDTLTTALAADINTQIDAAVSELSLWPQGGKV